MNKFTVAAMPIQEDKDNPVLFKVELGSRYYIHKGKALAESVNRLLDDVFRGVRDKKCPDHYSLFVEYCKRYPAINKVTVSILLNDTPAKVLAAEGREYKKMKKDSNTLNRLDLEPYKPEWMLRAKFQEKCNECVIYYWTGISMSAKQVKAKFCPNCGRANK